MIVEIAVEEIMRTDVATATPEETVLEVARRIHESDHTTVVLVEDGRPTGIVTEADVVGLFVTDAATDSPVSEIATAPVITVERGTTLQAAATTMREENVPKLPVCDADGSLVGIVTTVELSNYIPAVVHSSAGAASRSERRRQTRPDTAYEADDWEFESYGEDDTRVEVGDRVQFSKTVDGDDVTAFAEASGDTNRLHLDEEYAAGTRFGERIAHGSLVAGLISAALARLPGLTIYLSQEVTYSGPVPVGDRVTARCEVVESLGEDRFRLTTEVVDEESESVVVDGQAVVMSDELPASA